MYLEHFGLREYPFSLTPDTAFYFNHPGHQEALNVLMVALDAGEGFIKITGEVGTGKTLLCRKLLDALDGSFVSAYIPNPLLSPRQLHSALASELGIDARRDATSPDLLKAITHRLVALSAEGKKTVLCIDEVQTMSQQSLEALRLLSNLETEKRKLLSIVLFGQPELNQRLESSELRQLRQRITFAYHLPPLDRDGVKGYVTHRQLVAGFHGGSLFQLQTLDLIARASRGIPRLVNILCHKGLLAAYGSGEKTVRSHHIKAAVADTEDAIAPWSSVSRWLVWGGFGLAALAGITAAVSYYMGVWS